MNGSGTCYYHIRCLLLLVRSAASRLQIEPSGLRREEPSGTNRWDLPDKFKAAVNWNYTVTQGKDKKATWTFFTVMEVRGWTEDERPALSFRGVWCGGEALPIGCEGLRTRSSLNNGDAFGAIRWLNSRELYMICKEWSRRLSLRGWPLSHYTDQDGSPMESEDSMGIDDIDRDIDTCKTDKEKYTHTRRTT